MLIIETGSAFTDWFLDSGSGPCRVNPHAGRTDGSERLGKGRGVYADGHGVVRREELAAVDALLVSTP